MRLQLARIQPSRGLILWAGLCLLISLGIVSTLVDFSHLPNAESRRANESGQRAVIDPVTGVVSLGLQQPDQAFDVSGAPVATPAAAAPTPAATNEAQTATIGDSGPAPAQALPDNLPKLRTDPLTSDAKIPISSIDRLVPAPAPEITEKIDGLDIPKRGTAASAPATTYSRHFKRDPDKPILTIVIMNTGISAQSLALITALPKNVTLAFSPYALDVTNSIATLRAAGYEVWGMLPLMSEHYPQDDPGPLGLVNTLPPDEIMRRLHTIMALEIGSVGVVFPPDETFTKTESFSLLLGDLLNRGFYTLSTHPTRGLEQLSANKVVRRWMRRADIILDSSPDEAQIQSKLDGIIATLKKGDSDMIVVTSARPQTLLLLQRWLKENPPNDVAALAPLSAFWKVKDNTSTAAEGAKEAKPGEAKKDDAKSPDAAKGDAAKPEAKPDAAAEKKAP